MELAPGAELQGGKYRIERALGSGGFGTTYLASQTLATRPTTETRTVVVKEYLPRDLASRDPAASGLVIRDVNRDAFDSGLKKFVREGRILLDVAHPNIVRVYELFEEGETAYLVMEHLVGGDLGEALERAGGYFDEARTREIMNGLVSALDALHRHDPPIYHLDIKPQNVLLRADGRPVMIDFGAARLDLPQTQTSLAFTLGYAPPELIGFGRPGPESDIYELGVLLYVMLTGVYPPNAMARSESGEAADWKPVLGEPWATVIPRALELRRDQRPTDVCAWWSHAASPDAHLRRRSTDHAQPGEPRRRRADRAVQAETTRPVGGRKFPPRLWAGVAVAALVAGGVGFAVANHPAPTAASGIIPALPAVEASASAGAVRERLTATLARATGAKRLTDADEEAVREAVRQGADVNAGGGADHESALHVAVALDRPALADFLLGRGADTEARDARGNTPLHIAVFYNRPAMVRKLLAAGARPGAQDEKGRTPADFARSLGYAEVAASLK